MISRWIIRAAITCTGLLVLASWSRRKAARGNNGLSRSSPSINHHSDLKPADKFRPASGKVLAGRVTAGATLVLAYLAVAVNAHWFPWQAHIPSITLELDPSGSHSGWYSEVNSLTDFLDSNYTHTVYLNLILDNFAPIKSDALAQSTLVHHVQSALVLYDKMASGPASFTAFYMGAKCGGGFLCTILTLHMVTGPGSSLGYVTQNAAATINIEGYYQIGATACQTGTCEIDMIPVEPPG